MALRRYVAEEIALDCRAGFLTRREALRRLGLLGLSVTAASVLLAACSDDEGSTTAPTTAASAPSTSVGARPRGHDVTFAGPRGQLLGSWATAATPRGSVLVVHENRGLTAHITTIPPRLAAAGYAALAIDLVSEEGGTAAIGDEARVQAAVTAAPAARLIEDLRAGLDELARRAPGTKMAAMGFCFGGGLVWQLLDAGEPRLAAAVPFYGPAPDSPDFAGSKGAAVLGIYAERDARVNASRAAATAALGNAGLVHEIRTLPGVDHAFFNDTGPRHDPAAAAQAYDAVLAWYARHLG